MGNRELVALLCLSSWCYVIVVWLFLTMPRVCLQFVIVVFPDHFHLLFLLYLTEVISGHLTFLAPVQKVKIALTKFWFYEKNQGFVETANYIISK